MGTINFDTTQCGVESGDKVRITLPCLHFKFSLQKNGRDECYGSVSIGEVHSLSGTAFAS